MSEIERGATLVAIAVWGVGAALVALLGYSAPFAALVFGVAVPGLSIAMYGVQTHAPARGVSTDTQPHSENPQ